MKIAILLIQLFCFVFLLTPISIDSKEIIGIYDGAWPGNTQGVYDGAWPGNTIGVYDGTWPGNNIYLTDSYNFSEEESHKVKILKNGAWPGNTQGVYDGAWPGNTIGVYDGAWPGNTIGFTDRPQNADIIIITDIDLITKIFSKKSIYKTLINNFHSSTSTGPTINNSNNCEGGHWVKTVANQGEIITLEDGSLWQVDAIDKVYSSIWLPISNVTICGSYLINTDDGEKVSATRIK